MPNNLNKHLNGILQVLKNKIELINNSVGHSLTKGEENERAIRDLLVEYLPQDYGIGSGVIVGIDGGESKQVDIIVYDKNIPNYTCYNTSKIFLVDQVLLTIEVKTNYETATLKEAMENVSSIKKLKYSEKKWFDSAQDFDGEGNMNKIGTVRSEPLSPVCAIFFFTQKKRESAINISELEERMSKEIEKYTIDLQPNILFSLDHSLFFKREDIFDTKTKGKYSFCFLKDSEGHNLYIDASDEAKKIKGLINYGNVEITAGNPFSEFIKSTNPNKKGMIAIIRGEENTLTPLTYKTGLYKDKLYFLDAFRAFFNFIYQLDIILKYKKSNKSLFIFDYFPPSFFKHSNFK